MTRPPNGERRPLSEERATPAEASRPASKVRDTCDTCADCAQREPVRGWRRCSVCLRAYVAGLDRRRAAELRLAPLDGAA